MKYEYFIIGFVLFVVIGGGFVIYNRVDNDNIKEVLVRDYCQSKNLEYFKISTRNRRYHFCVDDEGRLYVPKEIQ